VFGIRPTSLQTFDLTPRLPAAWDRMALKSVHAFGQVFDVDITRAASRLRVRVIADGIPPIDRVIEPGTTVPVRFR